MKSSQADAKGNVYGILAWVFLVLSGLSLYGIFNGNTDYSSFYQYTFLLSPLISLILSSLAVKNRKSNYIQLILSIILVVGEMLYIYMGTIIG